MKGRQPTKYDLAKMSEAVALITTYDIGVDDEDFTLFRHHVRDTDETMVEPLAQLAWLMLKSIAASSGHETEDILAWYGQKFAEGALKG